MLIDSGSDDHLCRHRFVPDAPVMDSTAAPKLYDVQRNPLPTAGRRGVEMTMAEGVKATADFLVADVGDDRREQRVLQQHALGDERPAAVRVEHGDDDGHVRAADRRARRALCQVRARRRRGARGAASTRP